MKSYRTFPLVGPIDNASTLSKAASAQNSSVIRMKKSVRLARIPRHKETTMTPWQAYGRRHVHGIGLETAQGHAHIEGGYAAQHLRVTVQVGAQPAQHRRVATMAQAQAWAEEQLR
jgi:hypothetical protein